MMLYTLLAPALLAAAPQTAPAPGARPDAPTGEAAPTMTRPVQPPQRPTPAPPEAQAAIAPEGTKAPAPAPTPTPSGTPVPPATAQSAAPEDVAAIVVARFDTFDRDRSGMLDRAEFGVWMDTLKTQRTMGTGTTADPRWNDAAFRRADADGSATVSRNELAGFLNAAAAEQS